MSKLARDAGRTRDRGGWESPDGRFVALRENAHLWTLWRGEPGAKLSTFTKVGGRYPSLGFIIVSDDWRDKGCTPPALPSHLQPGRSPLS